MPGIFINELQVSTTGADWEFVELFGTPDESLNGYTLLVVEADVGPSTGRIDRAIDLSGQTLGMDGLFLAASPSAATAYGVTADLAIPENTFENSSATYLLVEGFTGAAGDDLDTDDDGVLDSSPWTTLHDGVGVRDSATDVSYASTSLGPDGSFLPSGIARDTDGGAWSSSFLDFSTPDGTPGASNGTLQSGPLLSINDVTATEGDSGTTTFEFTILLSEAASVPVSVEYQTSDGSAVASSDYTAVPATVLEFAPGEVQKTISIDVKPDAIAEGNESFNVLLSNATNATISDGLGVGTIVNDDIYRISEIQGSGSSSPLDGQGVTVRAVVIGDFQNGDTDDARNLSGFYLQEEDADADGDALTSEGIFVFDGSFGVDVEIGDIVTVTGTVNEFFGETQIDTVTSVVIESSANALPTASQILLPTAGTMTDGAGDIAPNLEAYEGMLVEFPETLTINEMFQLDRFNEIKLYAGGRPQQFTQTNDPDAAGYAAYQEIVGSRTITYDDGLNVQNADIGLLDGLQGFDTANAVSMGDTVTGLTGVLDYKWAGNSASGATWRVRATEDGQNVFQDANPADSVPEDVGGDLKIASFNVLNFFTTLDLSGVETSVGADPRGADNQAEYDRQLEKLVTALATMDADVVGLVEIENDVSSAPLATLTAALNARLGSDVYGYVDTGQVGTDAITNAFIYKKDKVSLNGTHQVLDTDAFVDPLGAQTTGDSYNRPAIAQSFTEIASGESFTAVVNHLKSKGSLTGASADADQGDGAGNNNATRDAAAAELAAWLASDPTGDGGDNQIILGDLNAYAMEDPVQTLIGAGFDDLAQEFIGSDALSYVFDGLTGTLDYAMTNEGWTNLVAGVTEWHVSADEADALDYNLDFGRSATYFDGQSPLRASDHDPVIVGINLVADVVVHNVGHGCPKEKIGFATVARALEQAADGAVVRVTDPESIGDFGTVKVTADGLLFRAEAPVSGRLMFDDDVSCIRLKAQGDIDVVGNSLNNWIMGSRGQNELWGMEGADRLFGKSGKDILDGGAGKDILYGGRSADVFVLREGSDDDLVRDFHIGRDIVQIVSETITDFSQLEPLLSNERGGAVIDLGDGDEMKLQGVRVARLSADDFDFV